MKRKFLMIVLAAFMIGGCSEIKPDLIMKCQKVVTWKGKSDFKRCENEEVTCYLPYNRTAFANCHFK